MESITNEIEFDDDIFNSKLNNICEYDSKLKMIDKKFEYGTSGFRYDENELDKIAFRVSIVTCLLSQINEGQPMGIMITASHNKFSDNGIKIAGRKGESIGPEWENIYSFIINSQNLNEDIKEAITKIYQQAKRDSGKYFFRDCTPIINVGYDTRRSSEGLNKIITDALNISGAKFKVYGILTTPQLQFMTLINQIAFVNVNSIINRFYFSEVSEYWKFLSGIYFAFNTFYEQFYITSKDKSLTNKYEPNLLIDCANGAAAFHHRNISKIINEKLKLTFINTNYKDYESLNNGCGAEHVHKEKKLPVNYPNGVSIPKNVSFDGDVDRIIYFVQESGNIKTVDGDHLTCLFALTLKLLIGKLSLNLQKRFHDEIRIGVVSTAYSNGAFFDYIQNILNFTLILAKTGVKYLHQKATKFDIAIYFESNGHGTIYSHEDILKKIQKLNCFIESSTDSQILELMSIYLFMFNRTTGDSLSALIAVESSLKLNDMALIDLYNTYVELESVNDKVVIKDKNVFIPNEDDSRLIEPKEVQAEIDNILVKYSNCRCFVRPSGTENIVRIYAEAQTLQEAQEISNGVKKCIFDLFS